ncbi:MAG TPA: sigma factor [Bacteroidales bacterium]|nr:sigma factor [Bacteroidales bacterium]HQQ13487.1 sigma factor [Bacteroidales bacterium]
MNKNDEDRLWISQVLNGRHQSFGMLVDRYQDKVYGIVRRIIRDEAEAEDIAQNVFIKAFSIAPYLQPPRHVFDLAQQHCLQCRHQCIPQAKAGFHIA